MTRNIHYRPLFSKACLVVLATAMLLILAGLSAAEDQTFCGTKQCRTSQDLQGNHFVEFSCHGQISCFRNLHWWSFFHNSV